MADESLEMEQQPRTQATDEGDEEYEEAGNDDKVNGGEEEENEEGVEDEDDDIEFVESRPAARTRPAYRMVPALATLPGAMGGRYEEEEEEEEEEYYEEEEEEYYEEGLEEGEEEEEEDDEQQGYGHRPVGGKTPAVNGNGGSNGSIGGGRGPQGGGFGAQHDEDFAKRVVHVALRERSWTPEEVGDIVSLLFGTLRYSGRPQKVHDFIRTSNVPIEDPGFFITLNRDVNWISSKETVSLVSSMLDRDDFCNTLPRFVAESAIDLLSAGTVDRIVQVTLGRTDLDDYEKVELLRNVVGASSGPPQRRAMVLAVDRGLDGALKQMFLKLMPDATAFLEEEGRADKPISIDDDEEEEEQEVVAGQTTGGAGGGGGEAAGAGGGEADLEVEAGDDDLDNVEGPVLAPEPSLTREQSVMGLAKAAVSLDVPLMTGEEDDEVQRNDLQRIDSFKRKWPGAEDEENEEPEHFRLKSNNQNGDMGEGGEEEEEEAPMVLPRTDSLNLLEEMA